MKLSKISCSFLLLTVLFYPWKLCAQNPGDVLFGMNGIHTVEIDFTQFGWWDTLTANKAQSDQDGIDYYMSGTVTIDGIPLDSVGVRLKGNASYNHPGTKKPIRLEFDEYRPSQRYDGLSALHLNNSAYDPTMLREKLMLDALRNQGIPAPRCAFALVYFNNAFVGVYNMIEHIDKKFLRTHFNDDRGNLFKGDPNGTLEWLGNQPSDYYSSYELKTNEIQNDWSDLVNLIDKVNNTGLYFPTAIREVMDVDGFLWYLAANNVFGNLDSYVHNPHNYYLYHDSITNKFEWIAWDVGLSFGVFPTFFTQSPQDMGVFYYPGNGRTPLTEQLFRYPEFKQIYLNAMCTFLHEEFSQEILYPRIDSLSDLIRPWVYAEITANKMYTTEQFEGNLGYTSYSAWILSKIPGLKDFIWQRTHTLAMDLCKENWSCMTGNTATYIGENGIIITPNPSTDKVTIRFASPDNKAPVNYEITDMLGRVIFREESMVDMSTYSRELDFTGYAEGVYVMRVVGLCETIEQKIVIVH